MIGDTLLVSKIIGALFCRSTVSRFKRFVIFKRQKECFPPTISYHLYYLRISKVWSMLHHKSVGRVQGKQSISQFTYTFLAFLLLFYVKKFASIIFICFLFVCFVSLMKYQISAHRTSHNQKPELMIRNCQ